MVYRFLRSEELKTLLAIEIGIEQSTVRRRVQRPDDITRRCFDSYDVRRLYRVATLNEVDQPQHSALDVGQTAA